jgi:hypothetical protein
LWPRTDAQFLEYIREFWVPETTAEGVSLNTLYPSDQIDGSPFDTGFLNAVTPQFKRIAAFQASYIQQFVHAEVV